jgi:hypothetical protein
MKYLSFLLAQLLSAATLLFGEFAVQPNPALVRAGGDMSFTFVGDSTLSAIQWQVVPAWLGSIDAGGHFISSGKPGRGLVRAVSGANGTKIVGHAMLRVFSPTDRRLKVAVVPSVARIDLSSPFLFRAEVRDLEGTPVEKPDLFWKVVPQDLGTIDDQGRFLPHRAGRGRIVALARGDGSSGLGQSRVIVAASRPASSLKVEIEPRRLRLEPGALARLYVSAYDSAGNRVSPAIDYKVTPASLGLISPDGVFAASSQSGNGIITVRAEYQGSVAQVRSSVTVVAGQIKRYRVQLKPKTTLVAPSQSAEFEPACFDANGNQVTPPYWVWKVVPQNLGTITPEGLFTAGDKAIQGKVVVSLPPDFGIGQDFASVRIKPGMPRIVRVSPSKVLLKPGESKQFTASASEQTGLPVENGKFIWKVSPPDLGTITPEGLFTAGPVPRLGTVVAILPPQLGGGRGYAVVGVSNYTVQILGPRPRHLSSGEVHPFQAEVRDQSGNLVPGAVFEWSASSLYPNFGSIDPSSGIFTAGLPAAQQAEGNVLVRVRINGHVAGGDGIRVIVHRP